MKYYDFALAPNPRRVTMFMLEKGITVETVEVNIRNGEHFSPAFLALNPRATVPVLELDDGTALTETMAICRYLEAVQPMPRLFGSTPLDIALIEMWSRRAEIDGFLPAADALRNGLERFANRAVPGTRDYAQIPALAERGAARTRAFFEDLNGHLAGREFVATRYFSAADITAYITVEFAARVGVTIESLPVPQLARWFKALSERPSVKAMPPAPA